MKQILVLNGPNLNLLGTREPEIYGTQSLADLESYLREYALERDIELSFFQSNHEGVLIDALHQARHLDGIIYNPGAHTHYSYALHDAVAAIEAPVVEVHLSDISKREDFRKISVIAPACKAQVAGKGFDSYTEALDILLATQKSKR